MNILDVPTHIFTWGNWIEESFSKKEIVLCITGNPGLAGYYMQFMKTIHEKLGHDIPVWVIGKCHDFHFISHVTLNDYYFYVFFFFFGTLKVMLDTMNQRIVHEMCRHWKAMHICTDWMHKCSIK